MLTWRDIDKAKANSAMLVGDVANLRIDGQGQLITAEWEGEREIEHLARFRIQRSGPKPQAANRNINNSELGSIVNAFHGQAVSRMLPLNLGLMRDFRH
nr:hypothetical protein [Microvirga arabica]